MLAAASALLIAGCATYGDQYGGDPYGQPQYPVGSPDYGYGPPPGAYPPPPGAYPPGSPPTGTQCPITRSGEWNAWVNMMPGPGARPTLHVTGKVVVPTGGHQMRFDPLIVRESFPAQGVARLRVTPPSGPAAQAVMTHDVRWEWPLTQQVGSLEIVCEGETLARITQVQQAH
jgi:hypothetical protein